MAMASPTSTSARSIAFHREQGAAATVTAVQPAGRFGALDIEGDRVREFEEKPRGDGGWTNGGFFVLSPAVAKYLRRRARPSGSRSRCARWRSDGQLACYRHDGFWQAMDTLRDRNQLESLWSSGRLPGGPGPDGPPMSATQQTPATAVDPAFWRDRRVLLTGHTGFKGAGCRCGCSRLALR